MSSSMTVPAITLSFEDLSSSRGRFSVKGLPRVAPCEIRSGSSWTFMRAGKHCEAIRSEEGGCKKMA